MGGCEATHNVFKPFCLLISHYFFVHLIAKVSIFMESLSEYIPLLLIVGSIIVSVISGSRKKKVKESRETYTPKESSVPEFNPHAARYEKKKETPVLQKISSKPSDSKQSKKIVLPEEEPSKPFVDVSDLDEIKKAVIYTEIFTRKEY